MSEQAMDQTDDDGFTHDVSDEALEAAAEVGMERGPNTGSFNTSRPAGSCC